MCDLDLALADLTTDERARLARLAADMRDKHATDWPRMARVWNEFACAVAGATDRERAELAALDDQPPVAHIIRDFRREDGAGSA